MVNAVSARERVRPKPILARLAGRSDECGASNSTLDKILRRLANSFEDWTGQIQIPQAVTKAMGRGILL